MLIRKQKQSTTGWNNGDIDTAFQLFSCGMVWDGNLCSKSSRDHLVADGYAIRSGGMLTLTGRGTVAFLLHPRIWLTAFYRWRRWGGNPFVVSADQVARAVD